MKPLAVLYIAVVTASLSIWGCTPDGVIRISKAKLQRELAWAAQKIEDGGDKAVSKDFYQGYFAALRSIAPQIPFEWEEKE